MVSLHELLALLVANVSNSLQHNNGFRTRRVSLDFDLELGHAQIGEDWSLCYHESGMSRKSLWCDVTNYQLIDS
jgi:hypothetical protein